jgi:nitroreductase
MRFIELARKRTSIRKFRPDPVTDQQLEAVIEAARLAPSACNRQPWHLIVIREEGARKKLIDAYPRQWFVDAPVILALCTDPSNAWKRKDGKNYADVDGAIAMDHLTLCAADLGLGTCWIGAFDPLILRGLLNLPDGIEPLALTPLGIPHETGRPKMRKDPPEFLHTDAW